VKRYKRFDKTIRAINALVKVLSWISAAVLIIAVLMVVANILGRSLFKKPVPGTIELVEMLSVVVVFFGMAYTEFRRGHVHVELLTSLLSRRLQGILASVMSLLAAVYFAIMAWRCAVLAWEYWFPTFRQTYILLIPFTPFIFLMAFGSAVLVVATLVHVFRPQPTEEEQRETR
jgi:TRAP-type C4-dicarboxylate transport system permease small subunit